MIQRYLNAIAVGLDGKENDGVGTLRVILLLINSKSRQWSTQLGSRQSCHGNDPMKACRDSAVRVILKLVSDFHEYYYSIEVQSAAQHMVYISHITSSIAALCTLSNSITDSSGTIHAHRVLILEDQTSRLSPTQTFANTIHVLEGMYVCSQFLLPFHPIGVVKQLVMSDTLSNPANRFSSLLSTTRYSPASSTPTR